MHLAPLFGETLISCGWSSAAPRAGALSVFWTAAIPRLSAFQRALSIFARCYSRNTYPFLPAHTSQCSVATRFSLLPCTCTLGQHQNSVWLTSLVKKIASLMFGRVCWNGQARSRSINYFHAYRMQIVQSDFIYRCPAKLMDSYYLYSPVIHVFE